eukprot:Rmarinus@m.19927
MNRPLSANQDQNREPASGRPRSSSGKKGEATNSAGVARSRSNSTTSSRKEPRRGSDAKKSSILTGKQTEAKIEGGEPRPRKHSVRSKSVSGPAQGGLQPVADTSQVRVAVRVRPLPDESLRKKPIVRVVQDKIVVVLDPTEYDVNIRQRTREKQYAFDVAFCQDSSQHQVYEQSAKNVIDGVLSGQNATVFAYGATGAGKTHTMLGTDDQPGVMMLSLQDLFEKIEQKKNEKSCKVTLSYLEVYNENIRDLLSSNSSLLDLREDPLRGPVVVGLTEYATTSSAEIMTLLQRGNRRRTVEPTSVNLVSSRSHAVLQIMLEQRDAVANVCGTIHYGKLSLIDLAGSERASQTKNRGQRLLEGANINRSLLALANCINALGDKNRKGTFVPYRDSKLTRLLKDSLGGKCRTVMIACVASSSQQFEETLNTLKYANRAKNIKTKVSTNVSNVTYHIAEFQKIIEDLRAEVFELRQQLATVNPPEPFDCIPTIEEGKAILLGGTSSPREGNAENCSSTPTRATSPYPPAVRAVQSPCTVTPRALTGSRTPYANVSLPLTPVTPMRERLERVESEKIRAEFMENFSERMQLRKSLIELEDQNYQNLAEIRRHEADLQDLLIAGPHTHSSATGAAGATSSTLATIPSTTCSEDEETPGNDPETGGSIGDDTVEETSAVRAARREIDTLRASMCNNNEKKEQLRSRLEEIEKNQKKILEDIPTRVTSSDRRQLLELIAANHVLELQVLELQLHLSIRDKMIEDMQRVLRENDIDMDYTGISLPQLNGPHPHSPTYSPNNLAVTPYPVSTPLSGSQAAIGGTRRGILCLDSPPSARTDSSLATPKVSPTGAKRLGLGADSTADLSDIIVQGIHDSPESAGPPSQAGKDKAQQQQNRGPLSGPTVIRLEPSNSRTPSQRATTPPSNPSAPDPVSVSLPPLCPSPSPSLGKSAVVNGTAINSQSHSNHTSVGKAPRGAGGPRSSKDDIVLPRLSRASNASPTTNSALRRSSTGSPTVPTVVGQNLGLPPSEASAAAPRGPSTASDSATTSGPSPKHSPSQGPSAPPTQNTKYVNPNTAVAKLGVMAGVNGGVVSGLALGPAAPSPASGDSANPQVGNGHGTPVRLEAIEGRKAGPRYPQPLPVGANRPRHQSVAGAMVGGGGNVGAVSVVGRTSPLHRHSIAVGEPVSGGVSENSLFAADGIRVVGTGAGGSIAVGPNGMSVLSPKGGVESSDQLSQRSPKKWFNAFKSLPKKMKRNPSN